MSSRPLECVLRGLLIAYGNARADSDWSPHARARATETFAELVSLVMSEHDSYLAVIREVAAAFDEWQTEPDEGVVDRLFDAMGACQKYAEEEGER